MDLRSANLEKMEEIVLSLGEKNLELSSFLNGFTKDRSKPLMK